MRRLLAMLALTSCAGEIAGSSAHRSGRRLEVQVLRAEGLSTLFDGVYDRELGARCTAMLAEDGEVRCLPEEFEWDGSYRYADPECSVRLYADKRGWATARPDNDCSLLAPNAMAPGRPHRLERAPPGPVFWKDTPHACTKFLEDGAHHYALAHPVAPETFVRLASANAGQGRLQRLDWVAEDGSRFQQLAGGVLFPPMPRLFDTVLGTPCSVARADDGTLRCLPVENAIPGSASFADPECTVRAGPGTCNPAAPWLLHKRLFPNCSYTFWATIPMDPSARLYGGEGCWVAHSVRGSGLQHGAISCGRSFMRRRLSSACSRRAQLRHESLSRSLFRGARPHAGGVQSGRCLCRRVP